MIFFQAKKLDEESTTSSLVTTALVESPPHSAVGSVLSSNGSRVSESSLLACSSGCSGSDSGHHESNSSHPSTPRTGSHYDHDSGILGESELCNDSFSSGSDSGFCHHDKKTCSRCSTDDGTTQDLTELLDETKETKSRGRRQIGMYDFFYSLLDTSISFYK